MLTFCVFVMLWRLKGPWLTLPGCGDGLEGVAWLYSPKQGSGGRTGGLHPLILVYRKRPLSVCCSRSTFAVRWRHGLWSGSTLKVLTVSDGEDRCLEVQGLDYGSLAEGSLAWLSWTGVGHLVLTVQTSLLRLQFPKQSCWPPCWLVEKS